MSGVSIGAINAAIIAGNPPRATGCERLREFWERITERKVWHYTPDGDIFRQARNATSSWLTMMQGQPGFFKPRYPNPWMSLAGAHDGDQLLRQRAAARHAARAGRLLDSSTTRQVRFSVGAVNVLTGNFVYFDNRDEEIEPEHIMASGALPPALPMVKIGTDYFWDGGIVSNTPLQHLLDQEDELNTLVFQVDLFSARGALPRDMPGRAGAPQGHHVFVAHALQHRRLSARCTTGRRRSTQALAKMPRGAAQRRRDAAATTSWPTCRRSPSCT